MSTVVPASDRRPGPIGPWLSVFICGCTHTPVGVCTVVEVDGRQASGEQVHSWKGSA